MCVSCSYWRNQWTSFLELVSQHYNGLPFVRTRDDASAFGIHDELPRLVLFQEGLPDVYETQDLTELASVKSWLKEALADNDLDVLDLPAVEKFARSGKPLLAVFVNDAMQRLEREEDLMDACQRQALFFSTENKY